MASLYQYCSMPEADFRRRFQVGKKITEAEFKALLRCCTVLSNQRWSSTFQFAKGFDFTSGSIYVFYPNAGTGRQRLAVTISADTITAYPTVAYQRMTGTNFGSVSSASTSITWPTAVCNPGASRIYTPSTVTSYVDISYRNPTQYGCGRLYFSGLTSTGPLSVTLYQYPYGGYSSGQVVFRGQSSKSTRDTCCPLVSDDATSLYNINGGFLRAMEEMLDHAETMPQILYMFPRWTGAAPTAPFANITAAAAQCTVQSACTKRIPLVNLRRKRSIWVALYRDSWTAAQNIEAQVSVNGWRQTYNTNSEYCRYKPAYNRLFEFPIPLDAYSDCPDNIAGIPVAEITVVAPTCQMQTAWIGDSL